MTTDQADVKESHEQMRAAWSLYARSCPEGEVVDAAGLCLANARQPWALMNAALLPAPEDSDADLAAHATAAIRYYNRRTDPGSWRSVSHGSARVVRQRWRVWGWAGQGARWAW